MSYERIRVSAKLVSASSSNKHSKSSDIYTLSEEQKAFYRENGYIVIRGLVDHKSLDKYRQYFADICDGKQRSVSVIKEVALIGKNKKLEEYVNKIQDILYDEVFMTYSEDPKILDIASQFVGDEITAINLMLINKPPGTIRHPPHQDLYYFPFRPLEKIIGVWTAIDPAHVLNGCLFVIPGSHKMAELLKHENLPGDSKKFFHVIVDENKHAPLDKRVNLEMEPGDTVFFHPCLLHGSGPNLTQDYRKALTVHYANTNCQYIDVTGTVQQDIVDEFKRILEKGGVKDMNYIDALKLKSKVVRGVRSNL